MAAVAHTLITGEYLICSLSINYLYLSLSVCLSIDISNIDKPPSPPSTQKVLSNIIVISWGGSINEWLTGRQQHLNQIFKLYYSFYKADLLQ